MAFLPGRDARGKGAYGLNGPGSSCSGISKDQGGHRGAASAKG